MASEIGQKPKRRERRMAQSFITDTIDDKKENLIEKFELFSQKVEDWEKQLVFSRRAKTVNISKEFTDDFNRILKIYNEIREKDGTSWFVENEVEPFAVYEQFFLTFFENIFSVTLKENERYDPAPVVGDFEKYFKTYFVDNLENEARREQLSKKLVGVFKSIQLDNDKYKNTIAFVEEQIIVHLDEFKLEKFNSAVIKRLLALYTDDESVITDNEIQEEFIKDLGVNQALDRILSEAETDTSLKSIRDKLKKTYYDEIKKKYYDDAAEGSETLRKQKRYRKFFDKFIESYIKNNVKKETFGAQKEFDPFAIIDTVSKVFPRWQLALAVFTGISLGALYKFFTRTRYESLSSAFYATLIIASAAAYRFEMKITSDDENLLALGSLSFFIGMFISASVDANYHTIQNKDTLNIFYLYIYSFVIFFLAAYYVIKKFIFFGVAKSIQALLYLSVAIQWIPAIQSLWKGLDISQNSDEERQMALQSAIMSACTGVIILFVLYFLYIFEIYRDVPLEPDTINIITGGRGGLSLTPKDQLESDKKYIQVLQVVLVISALCATWFLMNIIACLKEGGEEKSVSMFHVFLKKQLASTDRHRELKLLMNIILFLCFFTIVFNSWLFHAIELRADATPVSVEPPIRNTKSFAAAGKAVLAAGVISQGSLQAV